MKRSIPSNRKPKASTANVTAAHFQFDAIGTAWDIEVFGKELAAAKAAELKATILKRIDQFDKHYSRFRNDSLVTAIAKSAGTYDLPADAQPMLKLYHELYKLTSGAVTPLIGQTLSDTGYDASYTLIPKKQISQVPSWESRLNYQPPRLTVTEPVLLDFGAAGKGYLTDLIADLLQARGYANYCINAGGDIVYHSATNDKLPIGLEHPDNPDMAIGVAHIANQSLCGSSGNRRSWDTFHHIVDPKSLQSPQHIKAVWVTAESGLIADGLATALFFVPANKLKNDYTFEYAIVADDYSLEHSPHFPAEFFTNQPPGA